MDAKTIIEQLGGAVNVASALGLPNTTVYSWKQRNSIPAWRKRDVAKLAKRKGVSMVAGV